MSNLDATYAYHRGTVNPSQVGSFAYVIPSPIITKGRGLHNLHRLGPSNGVGGLTKVFYASSEKLIDVANALVDTNLPVHSYSAISKILATGPGPHRIPESLTHIYFYMGDTISAVQEVPYRQHQLFYGTFCAL